MKTNLKFDLLEILAKNNIISDLQKRNEEIRLKFSTSRRRGNKAKDAIWQLTEEYFLSYKNIETILYSKRKKKSSSYY